MPNHSPNILHRILTPLNAVRRRLQIQRVLNIGTVTLFTVSMLTAIFFLGQRLPGKIPSAGFDIFVTVMEAAALIGALLVFAVWLFFAVSALRHLKSVKGNTPAQRSDECYCLKDRLLTATQILKKNGVTPLEQLQLEDAAVFADGIEPQRVAPYRVPKYFKTALAMSVLAFVLGVLPPLPQQQDTAEAVEPVPQTALSVTQLLGEDFIEDIEQLAEKNPNERTVKELSDKMKEYVKRLEEVKNDRKEILAAVSEMEEELRQAIRELQHGTGETMKKIGEALTAAQATQQAGEALKDGRFADAKEQLQKFDGKAVNSMTSQERDTVTKMMEDITKAMEQSGQQNGQQALKDAAQKFGDAMDVNDGEKAKEAAAQLAEESGKQALRNEITEALEGKLSMLGLNKSEQNGGDSGEGANDGGNSTNKATEESKNWGTGAAGNPNEGQETNLEGNRERQNITGSMTGEGESEYEKFRSNDVSQEQTSRQFRESFQEYRRMSEQVLESEPLPLGQRQMIRRYFKAIEPKE